MRWSNLICASWLFALFIQTAQSFRRLLLSNASRLAYDKAVFMGTHNSAEINSMGIYQQLELGCRFIEIDIFSNEFSRYQDYRLGHDRPDDSRLVKGRSGNPNTALLGPWMRQIQEWRANNLQHAPLVIMFDMKNDLSESAKEHRYGGFSRLQDHMQDYFGDSLYWAKSQRSHGWPSVQALMGRVIVLLSGNENARNSYYVDNGYNPAIAVGRSRNVIEVHSNSDSTNLYYWTGKTNGNSVTWKRHGKYATGRQASVAIHHDIVVEVHKSEKHDDIFYHVGKLNKYMEMEWGPSHRYDSGTDPTVSIMADGRKVREVHRSANTGKAWEKWGTINVWAKTISWSGAEHRRDVRLLPRTSSGGVHITTDGGNLRYLTTGSRSWLDVSYDQLFFVERQPGCWGWKENHYPLSQAVFYGVKASCHWLPKHDGVAIRAWSYDPSGASKGKDPGNFPATDWPRAEYRSFVASLPNGIVY